MSETMEITYRCGHVEMLQLSPRERGRSRTPGSRRHRDNVDEYYQDSQCQRCQVEENNFRQLRADVAASHPRCNRNMTGFVVNQMQRAHRVRARYDQAMEQAQTTRERHRIRAGILKHAFGPLFSPPSDYWDDRIPSSTQLEPVIDTHHVEHELNPEDVPSDTRIVAAALFAAARVTRFFEFMQADDETTGLHYNGIPSLISMLHRIQARIEALRRENVEQGTATGGTGPPELPPYSGGFLRSYYRWLLGGPQYNRRIHPDIQEAMTRARRQAQREGRSMPEWIYFYGRVLRVPAGVTCRQFFFLMERLFAVYRQTRIRLERNIM